MKKYIFITAIFASVIITALSCSDDFVDREVQYSIDSENYLNTQHIVAVSTFTSPDGNVKITIDTVTAASGHGSYVVNQSNEEEASRLLNLSE